MPYTGPGERVEKQAPRALEHGQLCVIDNQVGVVAKVAQLDRFVRPDAAEATAIAEDEVVTLFVTGVHEVKLEDGLAAAAEGDLVYIDPADDTLRLAADAEVGDLPVGVIQEIDASRTPDVARVNLNTLHAFFPKAA